MTTSDKRLPPSPDTFEEALTNPPCATSLPKVIEAPLPLSNFFAPMLRLDSVSRYFRRARERAADGAVDEQTVANGLSNAGIRQKQQPKLEEAAIKSALHSAENEGWNTSGVAPPQQCSQRTPSARRSGRA